MTHALTELHPAAQRDNLRWRGQQLGQLKTHDIVERLAEHTALLDANDYREGNQQWAVFARELRAAHIQHAFDEDAIRAYAENYARIAARIPDLERRTVWAIELVPIPTGRGITAEGVMNRLADPLWWRRQLRKCWTRGSENAQRAIGMVRKGRAAYASDDAVKRRAAQRRKTTDYLQSHDAVNLDTAEKLNLANLAEHSLANPALRRGEFMTRLRGLHELSQCYQHEAIFVTMTTPSCYHAQLAGGGRNPSFNPHLTVQDAQAWLRKMWARARAALHRREIKIYGFRIAEPHHDGTPHWHGVFFTRRQHLDTVRTVCSRVYLKEFGDEPGARDHRVRYEVLDPARGDAVGYLAKYVAKNIDAKGAIGAEVSDESGSRITDDTTRVDAWASTHGIRQFQEIGTPPIGIYREARRLRHGVQDPDIERARDCADRGRYARFVQCLGGIDRPRVRVGKRTRRSTNIRLERAERGDLNRYGEARPASIIGLRCASVVEVTRPHRWRIERGSCSSLRSFSALGPVAITVRGAAGLGEPAAWTNPSESSQAPPK